MSNFCVYVKLEPYLAEWFINENGGESPVSLPRGSAESNILEIFLQRRPAGMLPDMKSDDAIAIVIPKFKHKDPLYFNYLPPKAMLSLQQCIRHRFDIIMWRDLHKFGYIGRRQDELIYSFMEKHGISMTETNWNAIAKRYQRKRNIYLANERSAKAKSKK